jgi:DNA repair exonuclease SbcCD ATPase subunit
MDNDREITKADQTTDIVERSKMVFLREIINEFSRRQQQYDLESEFARTRKNRTIAIPLIIAGLILVFGVLVTLVTQYIQTSSLAIQVDIDDFADVNLRDILDEAQRLQNQLDSAERELQALRENTETQIRQVERARDRDIGLLAESDLTANQRVTRERQLRAAAEQEIERITAESREEIAAFEERIEGLRSDIAQYDSRRLEQAREQEEVLNNQQSLFELEMNELRGRYETQISRLTSEYEREIDELERFQEEFARTIRARHAEELARLRARHEQEIVDLTLLYNPIVDEPRVRPLLGATAPPGASTFRGPVSFRAVLQEEGALRAAEYRALVRQYEDVMALVARLQEVPYENSVPAVLRQLELRVRDLTRQYDRAWRVLGDSVENRDAIIAGHRETIAQFRYSLEERSRIEGDTGYIIDPRDSNAIVVFVNPILSVVPGSMGYVFRRDDVYIGTIRFLDSRGTLVARIEELVDDQEIRAFDKVLIEVQEGE